MNVLWSEPELAGFLHKRSRRRNSWKRRLFLLQGHALFYFLNEYQVRTGLPSAVIPMEGSRVERKETAGDFVFHLLLGPQYSGLTKRAIYILAADSQEALDAWSRMMKVASLSRDSLNGKLWRSRSRSEKLRSLLLESPSNKELLESKGSPKLEKFQRELKQSIREKEELNNKVEDVILGADRCLAAISHATASWDIMKVRESSKGLHGRSLSEPEHELEMIQVLYNLLQRKGNLYQGLGVESLRGAAQIQLRKLLTHALSLIQDRHAQIRAGAPRFSFHIDPKIYNRETFDGNEINCERRSKVYKRRAPRRTRADNFGEQAPHPNKEVYSSMRRSSPPLRH